MWSYKLYYCYLDNKNANEMDLTKVLKPYNVLSEKTIDKYIIQLQLNTKHIKTH